MFIHLASGNCGLEVICSLIKGNEASCSKMNGGAHEDPRTYRIFNSSFRENGLKQNLLANFDVTHGNYVE